MRRGERQRETERETEFRARETQKGRGRDGETGGHENGSSWQTGTVQCRVEKGGQRTHFRTHPAMKVRLSSSEGAVSILTIDYREAASASTATSDQGKCHTVVCVCVCVCVYVCVCVPVLFMTCVDYWTTTIIILIHHTESLLNPSYCPSTVHNDLKRRP